MKKNKSFIIPLLLTTMFLSAFSEVKNDDNNEKGKKDMIESIFSEVKNDDNNEKGKKDMIESISRSKVLSKEKYLKRCIDILKEGLVDLKSYAKNDEHERIIKQLEQKILIIENEYYQALNKLSDDYESKIKIFLTNLEKVVIDKFPTEKRFLSLPSPPACSPPTPTTPLANSPSPTTPTPRGKKDMIESMSRPNFLMKEAHLKRCIDILIEGLVESYVYAKNDEYGRIIKQSEQKLLIIENEYYKALNKLSKDYESKINIFFTNLEKVVIDKLPTEKQDTRTPKNTPTPRTPGTSIYPGSQLNSRGKTPGKTPGHTLFCSSPSHHSLKLFTKT